MALTIYEYIIRGVDRRTSGNGTELINTNIGTYFMRIISRLIVFLLREWIPKIMSERKE
jgi:hypothetical protein